MVCLICTALLGLLSLGAWSVLEGGPPDKEDLLVAALAADGEHCEATAYVVGAGGGGEGSCALSVLQRRSAQVVATAVARAPASAASSGAQTVYGHPSATKTYPGYDGFTLTLVEEFDTAIDLDTDLVWTWSDGGLLEGDIRFVKEGIIFEDGKMKLEVSVAPEEAASSAQPCSNAEAHTIPQKRMMSGEMRTRHNMFRYGRYEASIKAPSVQPGDTAINGNYVSTFFLFRDAKYRHWREIDFDITGDTPDAVTTNVLSADHTVRWSSNIAASEGLAVGENLRADFHTYAMEWLPHRIAWYLDGRLLRELTGDDHVASSNLSAKVMMNLWMFDERALFGGREIWNNQYPMHSEYDWFRFYRWDNDSHYPCPGFDAACLAPDDLYLSSNNPCDGIAQVGDVFGNLPCQAVCLSGREVVEA